MDNRQDEIDLFELCGLLWSRKWLIIFLTVLGAGLSIGCALYLKNVYKSSARILPPQEDKNKLSGLMSQLSALPLMGLSGMGADKADAFEILKAYLMTRENIWKVIDRFDLKAHFAIEAKFREDVEDFYRQKLELNADKKSGVITVSFSAMTPRMAVDVVTMNLDMLDEISRLKVVTENTRKLRFLEERLADATKDLVAIEEEIQQYKRDNHLLTVEGQAKATVEVAFRLQSEILLNQARLKVRLELGANDNHPEVKVLRLEIEALEKQMRDLEEGRMQVQSKGNEEPRLTFIPLAQIPRIELEMERLLRRKLIAQEVFSVLTKEHEIAKIESAKEQNLIQIVEAAQTPERKDKPRRSVIVIVATMASFMLACFYVLLLQAVRNRKASEIKA